MRIVKSPVLLLATTNPGKLEEMRHLLIHLPLELLTPAEAGMRRGVDETGKTYEENARLKAESYCQQTGHWTLADDTGLEVEALAGAPGLHSARSAGPGASDADRRAWLLNALRAHPRPWKARFVCAAALAGPGQPTQWTSGACPGEIIPEPRGHHGFGYDPIFRLDGSESTMAELPLELKNTLSHRAQAVQQMLPILRRSLGLPPG